MKVVRIEYGSSIRYGSVEDQLVRILSDAPWFGGAPTGETVTIDGIRLLAPCVPNKIIGVAINYPGATGQKAEFREPLVFLKPGTSVIGPEEDIVSPFPDMPIWGESELAVVIGARLSRCDDAQAKSGIFGYTIGNDVSAENVSGWDHHLARSKAADTFCVLGPWIDTDFEPQGRVIRGYQNGCLIRQGTADARLWAEPTLVSWLSNWMTLEPGDVILTGAPNRVRERQYLQEGDEYMCSIDGLGKLINRFKCNHAS